MAADDFRNTISANLSAGSSFDHQPSAGVEDVLLAAGCVTADGSAPSTISAVRVHQINGTDNDSINMDGNDGNMANLWFVHTVMSDNTNYWRIFNMGSTGDTGIAYVTHG